MDALSMDYDMEKRVKTDGRSTTSRSTASVWITTYRETFAEQSPRRAAWKGLIKSLADKNRQGDARVRVHHTENSHFPALVRFLLQGRRVTFAPCFSSRGLSRGGLRKITRPRGPGAHHQATGAPSSQVTSRSAGG